MAGEARFCGFCGAAAGAKAMKSDGARLTPEIVLALAGRGGEYYAKKLCDLFPSGSTSLKLSWNWAAALVPFWLLYRRLYLAWLGFTALAVILGHVHPALPWLVPIAEGLLGNALFLMALERQARERSEATALRMDSSASERPSLTSTAGRAS
jgi:hypothetical protein